MDTERDIYKYMNYREFLRDEILARKAANSHHNIAHFSHLAGLKTAYYATMVISGQRNISSKTATRFAKALGLDPKKTIYFETLVLFNQAHDDDSRDLYFDRLIKSRPSNFKKRVNAEQYEYFTNRYYVTIREMVALKEFREDPEWIANNIKPAIKEDEAKRALEVLLRLGLVERDIDGNLIHTRTSLINQPDLDALEIYNYQRSLLTEARNAILNESIDLTDMVAMTIPVSKKRLPQVREALKKCQEEVIRLISKDKNNFDEVIQLNLQYYPLTCTGSESE